MEVILAPEIEQVVLAKVAAGEYPSVTALVEEALFLLVERDWQVSRRELGERAAGVFDPPSADLPEGDGL